MGDSELPKFTPAGTFTRRNNQSLIKHSGIICLNFDNLENPEETRERLKAEPFVAAAFLSASGKGLNIFIPIRPVPSDAREHRKAFHRVANYFAGKHNLEADPSGANVSWLCDVSSDPDLYSNPEAKPFSKQEDPNG